MAGITGRQVSGFTLVLGGGGAPAMAYAAGALRALADHGGIDLSEAKAMIGTSAGAIVAADLRLGRSFEEIMLGATGGDSDASSAQIGKAWRSKPDLARRLVGSMWIMARTALPVRLRLVEPPALVQRAFPGSLLRLSDRDWASNRFPPKWPDKVLWLVTSDLDRGNRVVLAADAPVMATLPQAVQASCAVPGLYPPVRVDGRRLVDGGVHSVTNLDLAVRARSAAVIALAPMSFEASGPPRSLAALVRTRFNAQVAKEAAAVRRSGAALLLLRPTADEVRHHGVNILSRQGNATVMEMAYESVTLRLETPSARRVIDLIHGSPSASRRF